MLDAGVLTAAFTLLTARPDPSGQDPLASLVAGTPPGTVPPAIPSSWHPASPALAARMAHARDPWLRAAGQTLNRFVRDHGIPVRSRGTSTCMPASSAPGIHPRDLTEPLRSALIGRHARQRLDHLLIIAGHASIRQAARALGR
jgi:hypothetical protein